MNCDKDSESLYEGFTLSLQKGQFVGTFLILFFGFFLGAIIKRVCRHHHLHHCLLVFSLGTVSSTLVKAFLKLE